MHDALLVQVVECTEEFEHYLSCVSFAETACVENGVEQLAALEQLHDDVDELSTFVDFVESYDVRMLAESEDCDFIEQASTLFVVLLIETLLLECLDCEMLFVLLTRGQKYL